MARLIIGLGVLLVALPAVAQSQPARPAEAEQTTMGVLIGWNPRADGYASPEAAEQAQQDPELTATSETALADGGKASHHNQTEKADPLFTLWIAVSGGKVETRWLQHIVVPRKDGFWRLGTNTDLAEAEGGSPRAEEDFFWAAPLGQEPKLAAIADLVCSDDTASRELTYVGPEYVAYSQFATATCAHYDESHSYTVLPLAEAAEDSEAGVPRHAVSLVTLLGARAQQQYERLNREAQSWKNECGENGYEGSPTNWTLRHDRGRWQVVAKFVGSGAGVCSRYHEDRVLEVPLPRAVVTSNAPLPVPWKTVKRAFPQAEDAAASPDGRLLIVFAPSQVVVAAVEGAKLRSLAAPVNIAPGKPVLIEWAVGANATRWDQVFATLPPPNPKAVPHDPVP